MTTAEKSSANSRPFLILWGLALLPLFVGLAWQKQLSADGVHYLASILDGEQVFIFTSTRWAANYVTQWPVNEALSMGIENLSVLTFLFGLGLIFPFVLSIALSFWLLPVRFRFILTFPILAIWVIHLPIDYILAHELHTGGTLLWPLFFLLMRAQPFTWVTRTVGILLLIIVGQSYEPLGMSLGVVTLIVLESIRRLPRDLQPERYRWVIASGLIAAFTFAQGYFGEKLAPNRADFLAKIQMMLEDPIVFCPVVAAAFWLAWLIRPYRIFAVGLLGAAAFFLVGCFNDEFVVTAGLSYATRPAVLIWLPILFAAAGLIFRLRVHQTTETQGFPHRLWLATAVLFTVGHIGRQRHWIEFVDYYHEVLRGPPGYVEWTDFPDPLIWQGWSWNNPELSLFWSPSPVQVMVLNHPEATWVPFDPKKEILFREWFRISPLIDPLLQDPK